jgi:transcriptional regulator with XRE-family HTH domain
MTTPQDLADRLEKAKGVQADCPHFFQNDEGSGWSCDEDHNGGHCLCRDWIREIDELAALRSTSASREGIRTEDAIEAARPSRFDDNELAFLRETLFREVFGAAYNVLTVRKDEIGFTRDDLAHRTGWDKTSISKILKGPANWTLKTLSDFCNAVEVDVDIKLIDRRDPDRAFTPTGVHALKSSTSASGEIGAKAKLVPYSSVVGQSIMLTGYDGAVIAQLSIRNVQPASLSGDDRKKTTIAIAEWIVEALNARAPASGEGMREAVLAEREACAKMMNGFAANETGENAFYYQCAAASIRARTPSGETREEV